MNPEENIETQPEKDEQQALPPKPKIERVKKDLPKKEMAQTGFAQIHAQPVTK